MIVTYAVAPAPQALGVEGAWGAGLQRAPRSSRILAVPASDATCWTVIRKAAAGDGEARESFARRYEPAVRAYLVARWPGRGDDVDDAVQEVFLDCFRSGGALGRVDPRRPGGFRGFLYGVVRNVALRTEASRARHPPQASPSELDAVEGREENLSDAFDRAWALAVMREAGVRQQERARAADDGARRRVELLRLRFEEELPIREIARLWKADPADLHHEYAKAREEFRAALVEVVSFHHPHAPEEVERECAHLLGFFR